MAEDAVLERAEGMFDRRSSQSHQLWGGALMHAVQGVVVHVAAQHPLRGFGAARLHRAGAAVGGVGLVVDGAVLAVKLLALYRFARRTQEGVALGLVSELAAVEQRTVALAIDRAIGRDVRDEPSGLRHAS